MRLRVFFVAAIANLFVVFPTRMQSAQTGPPSYVRVNCESAKSVPIFGREGDASSVLGEVASGTVLARLGKNGSWFKIRMQDGKEGYLSAACAESFEPGPAPTSREQSTAEAIITACKPGSGVRLWKHFVSIRAYTRLTCGSTVEVLSYAPNLNVARVRQGSYEGYVEAWHINLSGSPAVAHPVLQTFLQTLAQAMQAYGNAGMDPRERLAQSCLSTPNCSLDTWTGQQWTPITQAQQVETYPDTATIRVSNGGNYYNAFVINTPNLAPYTTLPVKNSPALILKGDSLSLAMVNGYGFTLGSDGQWHPTGLGPGQQRGVEGTTP
jgi:hypothetical protein